MSRELRENVSFHTMSIFRKSSTSCHSRRVYWDCIHWL